MSSTFPTATASGFAQKEKITAAIAVKSRRRILRRDKCYYLPGLKLSFKLTERLNTRCSDVQSLLSGQK